MTEGKGTQGADGNTVNNSNTSDSLDDHETIIAQYRLDRFPGPDGCAECAMALGVGLEQWRSWETGRTKINFRQWLDLLAYFGFIQPWRDRGYENESAAYSILDRDGFGATIVSRHPNLDVRVGHRISDWIASGKNILQTEILSGYTVVVTVYFPDTHWQV